MAFLTALSVVSHPALRWIVLGTSLPLVIAYFFGDRIVTFYLNVSYSPAPERGRRRWDHNINRADSAYISPSPL